MTASLDPIPTRKVMFSRIKPPTISLPLYNGPRSPRPQYVPARRNKTRYMALGLVSFLALVTIFAFGRATPLILKSSQRESSMPTMQGSEAFQNNMEAITEIYRGIETPREHIDHLIIVTGHAILLDKINYMEDDAWVLEPFQKGGQVDTFVQHITKGVEMAKLDGRALLVFSGYHILKKVNPNGSGQTRPSAGPRSEGQSYWDLAHHIYRNDKTMDKVLLERVISEEYARDSYENVLFSLCRFFEMTGRYPQRITVIGFGFKEKRFTELHRKAVRFPRDRFGYIGIDPPNADTQELARLEHANAVAHFEQDPYACSSLMLIEKRMARNPFRRMHGYGATNPALLELLSWCPNSVSKTRWFDKKSLPWDNTDL